MREIVVKLFEKEKFLYPERDAEKIVSWAKKNFPEIFPDEFSQALNTIFQKEQREMLVSITENYIFLHRYTYLISVYDIN